jgi:hypothetical protein
MGCEQRHHPVTGIIHYSNLLRGGWKFVAI